MHQFLQFAQDVAHRASKELLSTFMKQKPSVRCLPKTVKTVYDEVSDSLICKSIEKKFPSHSYLTEETGLRKKRSDYLWIIDPLDGTGNYVNSNPFFAVSIALWVKQRPLLGVIEAPAIGEQFYAFRDKGAWVYNMRNKKLGCSCVSQAKDVASSYLVICDGGEQDLKKVSNILNQFYPKARDMRKLGSAALESAWVGTGRADAYITPHISLWDVAAGILFVKEAGGRILDFSLKPYKYQDMLNASSLNLVAANKKLQLPRINF